MMCWIIAVVMGYVATTGKNILGQEMNTIWIIYCWFLTALFVIVGFVALYAKGGTSRGSSSHNTGFLGGFSFGGDGGSCDSGGGDSGCSAD